MAHSQHPLPLVAVATDWLSLGSERQRKSVALGYWKGRHPRATSHLGLAGATEPVGLLWAQRSRERWRFSSSRPEELGAPRGLWAESGCGRSSLHRSWLRFGGVGLIRHRAYLKPAFAGRDRWRPTLRPPRYCASGLPEPGPGATWEGLGSADLEPVRAVMPFN